MTAADLFAAALRASTWDEYHRLLAAAQVADLDERARLYRQTEGELLVLPSTTSGGG